MNVLELYSEAAKTAVGFFWKAGWAFVLGYSISAMIQAFVPKGKLTPYLGKKNLKSVSLATLFGAASSSCSFAALATTRSLVMKGANFIAAVSFMFASTNLVIELGILILIFLGWQFLVAELIGGLILISISSVLIIVTYPRKMLSEARDKLEKESESEETDFDWRKRIGSRSGWNLVGHNFVSDWKMVWEEILIGFTIAGFVAVFIPPWVWENIFITNTGNVPGWLVAVENALVAPFVAAATFIGSMGNIPLATVLSAEGVLFAGVIAFIYSDLMVPPLVMINAKYYGWKVAIYIAAIMYVSILTTALLLDTFFGMFGLTPESKREVENVTRFAIDYTFYMNVAAIVNEDGDTHEHGDGGLSVKRLIVLFIAAVLLIGIVVFFIKE